VVSLREVALSGVDLGGGRLGGLLLDLDRPTVDHGASDRDLDLGELGEVGSGWVVGLGGGWVAQSTQQPLTGCMAEPEISVSTAG
jgi:hypothetical protein